MGEAARPADPKAASVLDRSGVACSEVGAFGQPLVVDWAAHERGDIEEAMHDGVAVVAYDCDSLKLLRGCSVEGAYGFLGFSRKEELVKLESADELRANLPVLGGAFAKDLGAELERGSTLDVAMILIGKKRTTVRRTARASLRGGAECAGATHFVRGAFVGAFALSMGTRGKVGAHGFGLEGHSESSKLGKYRDGDATSCNQSRIGAEAAPEACSAVLRLELVGLDGDQAPAPTDGDAPVAVAACPVGFVRSEGKCTAPSPSKAHECASGDASDCARQCELGNASSCATLGVMTHDGKGVAKDVPKSVTLFKRACDAGVAWGCYSLANAYAFGDGVEADARLAARLHGQQCDGGFVQSCSSLALLYYSGSGVEQSYERAAELYRRTCDGGSSTGCVGLAVLYADGTGVPKDEARAVSLYQRACAGDSAQGCGNLGALIADGRGAPANRELAAKYYRKACSTGTSMRCDGGECKEAAHWACDALKKLEASKPH